MQLFAAARGLSVALLGWTFVSFVPETESPSGTSTKQAPANHLADESSLYLKMHAHNPVDWHPWGPEAFALAKKENKPVFLSIGYSSCYWCHVMERLVFENEDIAKLMNEQFVCIKVDREERPDIDEVYMMSLIVYFRATGVNAGGGWPLSMFLTPDGKPIAGGTYFPPEDTERQLGFRTVLERMSGLWKDNRGKLEDNADILTNETRRLLKPKLLLKPVPLDAALVELCTQGFVDSADPIYGGVDFDADRPNGPKFPVPGKLAFLQQQAALRDRPEIDAVLNLTLRQMALGGIRDHLAGGFHRYTVDREWTVPHFEKMLYDQAQLAAVYAEASRRTPNPLYQSAACETLDFVLREMTLDNGLFAGSLDAETDGVEGAYYVWSLETVQKLLSEPDAKLFADAYSMEAEPAFEHGNVLRLRKPITELSAEKHLDAAELEQRLAACRTRLLVAREQRPKPVRDEKVVTSWNGLMIGAMAQAGDVFQRDDYLAAAKRAATALLADVRDDEHRLLRSLPTEKRSPPAFLEDYAFLIDGLLKLQAVTQDDRWKTAAIELQTQQDQFFADKAGGYFQTPADQPELIVRSKTNSDAVQPGGNSVSIRNLLRLAQLTGHDEYRQQAEAGLKAFASNLQQAPRGNANLAAGLSDWLALNTEHAEPNSESATTNDVVVAAADEAEPENTIQLTSSEEVANENPTKKKEHVKAKIFLSVDKLPAGDKCQFVVILDVQEGWHINANPPSPDNMIATTITVKSKHMSKQLDTKYPKGKEFTLEELPEALSVYEGEVQIRGVIEAPKDAAGKMEELEFQVRYQACNDKNCLPPKTLKLAGKINIVKPGTPVKQINAKYFPARKNAE